MIMRAGHCTAYRRRRRRYQHRSTKLLSLGHIIFLLNLFLIFISAAAGGSGGGSSSSSGVGYGNGDGSDLSNGAAAAAASAASSSSSSTTKAPSQATSVGAVRSNEYTQLCYQFLIKASVVLPAPDTAVLAGAAQSSSRSLSHMQRVGACLAAVRAGWEADIHNGDEHISPSHCLSFQDAVAASPLLWPLFTRVRQHPDENLRAFFALAVGAGQGETKSNNKNKRNLLLPTDAAALSSLGEEEDDFVCPYTMPRLNISLTTTSPGGGGGGGGVEGIEGRGEGGGVIDGGRSNGEEKKVGIMLAAAAAAADGEEKHDSGNGKSAGALADVGNSKVMAGSATAPASSCSSKGIVGGGDCGSSNSTRSSSSSSSSSSGSGGGTELALLAGTLGASAALLIFAS